MAGAFATLYFTPFIVAFYWAKPSRFGIAIFNLLAGWTVIGWRYGWSAAAAVAALVIGSMAALFAGAVGFGYGSYGLLQ